MNNKNKSLLEEYGLDEEDLQRSQEKRRQSLIEELLKDLDKLQVVKHQEEAVDALTEEAQKQGFYDAPHSEYLTAKDIEKYSKMR